MKDPEKTGTKDGTAGAPAMAAALMTVNPAATKVWLDVMSESARFMADRLQQDLETQKAMLSCKSPAELLKLQSEFVRTSMEQYAEEAARLFRMMSKIPQDTRSGHGRSYDDIPL